MADYGRVRGRVNGRVNEWIAKGMNERIIEEIKEEVKLKLYEVVAVIKDSPKLKTKDLAERCGVSKRTMSRYIKILQSLGIIQFIGVPKTGGYVLSSGFLKDIEPDIM